MRDRKFKNLGVMHLLFIFTTGAKEWKLKHDVTQYAFLQLY